MLSNLHTHSVYCDGKNTPEEIVLSAIDKKMDSIGFSGHGYTNFHLVYCMKDTEGYIDSIKALKEQYKNKIQIYLGVEEDAFHPVDRTQFDYIIGSSHYFKIGNEYFPIDSNINTYNVCLEKFGFDGMRMADTYYKTFCDYILKRKPDIIGHFDLISKYDEVCDNSIFLENKDYLALSEKYIKIALESNCFFEMNTGAISRGYRHFPYPNINLLHVLKKNEGKLVLSSDSHNSDTLDYYFEESRAILKDIGFEYVYVLYDGEFKKDYI